MVARLPLGIICEAAGANEDPDVALPEQGKERPHAVGADLVLATLDLHLDPWAACAEWVGKRDDVESLVWARRRDVRNEVAHGPQKSGYEVLELVRVDLLKVLNNFGPGVFFGFLESGARAFWCFFVVYSDVVGVLAIGLSVLPSLVLFGRLFDKVQSVRVLRQRLLAFWRNCPNPLRLIQPAGFDCSYC